MSSFCHDELENDSLLSRSPPFRRPGDVRAGLEGWVSRTESGTGTLLEVKSFYSRRRGMTALRDLSPEVTRLEAIHSEHHSQIQQTIVLFFIHKFGCGSVSLRNGWGDTI